MMKGEGYHKLWGWFGLSYASFLVMPRVLMHEMSDEWQAKMTELLEEYDDTFPNQPDISTTVSCRRKNRFCKFPSWVLNYRHPSISEIDKLRNGHS